MLENKLVDACLRKRAETNIPGDTKEMVNGLLMYAISGLGVWIFMDYKIRKTEVLPKMGGARK